MIYNLKITNLNRSQFNRNFSKLLQYSEFIVDSRIHRPHEMFPEYFTYSYLYMWLSLRSDNHSRPVQKSLTYGRSFIQSTIPKESTLQNIRPTIGQKNVNSKLKQVLASKALNYVFLQNIQLFNKGTRFTVGTAYSTIRVY